jgi:hypothetical protein
MNKIIYILSILTILLGCSHESAKKQEKANLQAMQQAFMNPPDSVKPWVLWDWISGNVTREGITRDLESMKKVGIGGVVWRGIGGLWWAPEGDAKPYSPEWNNLMQWAIQEADRLGIEFSSSQDFGYGSGGPHITPDNSMQQIVWKDTVVTGGAIVQFKPGRPKVPDDNISKAWLRPGKQLSDQVLHAIEEEDSYRDIAILAVPASSKDQAYTIPQLELRTAMGRETWFKDLEKISPPQGAGIDQKNIMDLTEQLDDQGRLTWDAPPGKWRIMRIGHASNYLMTRPCPADAVGLECNRLSPKGIDTHFERFMKPILEQAGDRAGTTFTHLFLDSWEAKSQNWTQEMPSEFKKRRGYDITPWLPVLTGTIVESAGMSERFLWDFRQTVNELLLDNYLHRLKELIDPYGLEFSVEAYGNLGINTLQFAQMGDFPVSEFWTMGDEKFPEIKSHKYYSTMKAMASAAHTTGKVHVGAEAFTGNRGWKDHPFIYKGVGDEAFCRGVNHFFLHLSAHQAYDHMIPGLTHQKWGGHFNRFNTWWNYASPWFEYIARCQYLLKQGRFVADVCYFFGEGSSLDVRDMTLKLPKGYDYDLCSADILQQMEVKAGRICLPSGMSYQYLLLPDQEYMTLASMKKIEALVNAGAKVIGQKKIVGTPGMVGYPESDQEVKSIAGRLLSEGKIRKIENWMKIFEADGLLPDFSGEGLDYIHRRVHETDIYFVSNPLPKHMQKQCTFRVRGKIPQLWNPETGEVRSLPGYTKEKGTVSVTLPFNPMQSWFILFQQEASSDDLPKEFFHDYKTVQHISAPWEVQFDPRWGGPEKTVIFEELADWRDREEPGIRFYSGTAIYRNTFTLPAEQNDTMNEVFIDLGEVQELAKVTVNGIDCGIAWKPPFRVNITGAVRPGENQVEIRVVNTWVNRMIGDEHLPEDSEWIDWVRLKEWPEWFLRKDTVRPSGRYTFTTVKHYKKDDDLLSSGLSGPVNIVVPGSIKRDN